ncbi:MAG: ABC transporter permease [Bryobacterales bacterium]|nr:ABC transporter permease [Bryobacterales bacterium]
MSRALAALIVVDLKLAFRDKVVIFFNYLFPLMFFFAFAEIFGGRDTVGQTVTMVLAIGILGNGLWGAGMRLVQERELHILRRFKVTPVTPLPLLAASLVTGLLVYLPAVGLTLFLAHTIYGMPYPQQWASLLAMTVLGVIAFRAIGLIVAAVVNSVQESTIVIQLLYMPMLLLSGATIPLVLLPEWARVFSRFLPASYLIGAFESILVADRTLAVNLDAAGAMLLTTLLATAVAARIFRWEKGERLDNRAKLWLAAVFAPFLALGTWSLLP